MADGIERWAQDYRLDWYRHPKGKWVKFTDHERVLAAAEARIKELEAAADRLANAVQKCRVGTGVSGTGLDAALAAYRENGGER